MFSTISWAAVDEAKLVSLGKALATCVPQTVHIFLYGDLGAGKTTFVRAFIHAFAPHERVKSPTFSLIETYHIHGHPTIHHLDLYRLKKPQELADLEIQDCFSSGICFVEWPEKGGYYLPTPDLECRFEMTEKTRSVQLIALTPIGSYTIQRFKKELNSHDQ